MGMSIETSYIYIYMALKYKEGERRFKTQARIFFYYFLSYIYSLSLAIWVMISDILFKIIRFFVCSCFFLGTCFHFPSTIHLFFCIFPELAVYCFSICNHYPLPKYIFLNENIPCTFLLDLWNVETGCVKNMARLKMDS